MNANARIATGILGFFLLANDALCADIKPGQAVWRITNVLNIQTCCKDSPKFVVSGGAATLVTNGEIIDLQASEGPLAASWAAAFDLRVDRKGIQRRLTAKADFRLFVSKTKATQIVVVGRLARKTFTKIFPEGNEVSDDIVVSASSVVVGETAPVVLQLFAIKKSNTEKISIHIDSVDLYLPKEKN